MLERYIRSIVPLYDNDPNDPNSEKYQENLYSQMLKTNDADLKRYLLIQIGACKREYIVVLGDRIPYMGRIVERAIRSPQLKLFDKDLLYSFWRITRKELEEIYPPDRFEYCIQEANCFNAVKAKSNRWVLTPKFGVEEMRIVRVELNKQFLF